MPNHNTSYLRERCFCTACGIRVHADSVFTTLVLRRSYSNWAELFISYFFLPKGKKKLLTMVLSTDDQSVCQWARIIRSQIQSWSGNKVNPLYDPATICVPVLIIGLFCPLHHELIQPGVFMIHINTEFQTKPFFFSSSFFFYSQSSWTTKDCIHLVISNVQAVVWRFAPTS